MLRYLAIVPNTSDAGAVALAAQWQAQISQALGEYSLLFRADHLVLFVAKSPFDIYRSYWLGESAGAVLGCVFDRKTADFDDAEVAEMVASGGRHLVSHYWGRYVAFVCDPARRSTWVLRDPVGDLPCFRAEWAGVSVYFSCLPDLMKLNGMPLSVNWRHIAVRAISGNAWVDDSALNEVQTVRPGECFKHSGEHVSRTFYWQPFEIAKAEPIQDPSVAAAQVRSVIRRCTHAWAGLHERAVHVLSGGLDSSVVVSCLAHAPSRPQISCLNFRTQDPDSDERIYARLAASRAGCELTEAERRGEVALERILECPPTVGPVNMVMRGLEVHPLVVRFAEERGATAVFSGDGGDMLFFHGWPQLAVIDYAYQRGFDANLMKLACAAALPAQLSVWKLLYDAARFGILRRSWDVRKILLEHYRLLSQDVVESAWGDLDFLNPWNSPVEDIPPGKRLHAFSMTRPSLFRDPLGGRPQIDIINPLVSQPVMELCLRIPTWIHAAGGRDRAVERDAFAADLPPEIVSRRWKGGADQHQDALLAGNLRLVRELLLDGQLVKQGILERKRVEACLSGSVTRHRAHATEVFGYVCTEAWLRHWAPRPSWAASAMSLTSASTVRA